MQVIVQWHDWDQCLLSTGSEKNSSFLKMSKWSHYTESIYILRTTLLHFSSILVKRFKVHNCAQSLCTYKSSLCTFLVISFMPPFLCYHVLCLYLHKRCCNINKTRVHHCFAIISKRQHRLTQLYPTKKT